MCLHWFQPHQNVINSSGKVKEKATGKAFPKRCAQRIKEASFTLVLVLVCSLHHTAVSIQLPNRQNFYYDCVNFRTLQENNEYHKRMRSHLFFFSYSCAKWTNASVNDALLYLYAWNWHFNKTESKWRIFQTFKIPLKTV